MQAREEKKQRHHCSLCHNASDGLFCSYLRVNQVSRQVLLLVWRINACPFLNRETIGTYQLLHFLQHLSSSFFLGKVKKKKCIFRKISLIVDIFFHDKLFHICLSIFVRGLNMLFLPPTAQSSRVRTSTRTSRCRLTWRSTSSSCCISACV